MWKSKRLSITGFSLVLLTVSLTISGTLLVKEANRRLEGLRTALSPIDLSRFQFSYRNQDFEMRLDQLQLPNGLGVKTPGLQLKTSGGSIGLKLRPWESLWKKRVKIQEIVIRGLKVIVEPDLMGLDSESAQSSHQNTPKLSKAAEPLLCSVIKTLEQTLGKTTVPVYLEETEIQIGFQLKHPLRLYPKKIFIHTQTSSQYCQTSFSMEFQAPQLAEDTIRVDGSIENEKETFQLSAKTELRQMNFKGINQTLLNRFSKDLSQRISDGHSDRLSLNVSYSSPTSFHIEGSFSGAAMKLRDLAVPFTEASGAFDVVPTLLTAQLQSARLSGLRIADVELNVPLTSPLTPIQAKGRIEGEPGVLASLEALKPYQKSLHSVQKLNIQAQGRIAIPKNSPPRITGDLQLIEIALSNPTGSKPTDNSPNGAPAQPSSVLLGRFKATSGF